MTRAEWLLKKHSELDLQIQQLELERKHIRSTEHKALLVDLKKQKLAIKTELHSIQDMANEQS